MARILDDPVLFGRVIGDYSPPQGDGAFIEALADLLRRELGWPVGSRNIALTSGSQLGFFMLFNLLAGDMGDGFRKQVLLPLCPEYIGYADLGMTPDLFTARRPLIEIIDEHLFKYRIDFDGLKVEEGIGAICLSRPTNPTGNVVTDPELRTLAGLARARGVPLVVDNAYGAPFPNILFNEVALEWDESMILTMSLSKLGLPGVRTGIIIAGEEIIEAVSRSNAIVSLAPGNIGPALVLDLLRSGELLRLSREVIRPYYQARATEAMVWLSESLAGYPYFVHKPEGGLFLWLWFRGLPITNRTLYARLKARGVLVVSGHCFFPGLSEDWRHMHECLRINYAQDPEVVRKGLVLLAEEVRRAYDSPA
jgi:valine--pyruvate aminotransferase